jgi:hypothetical protein
MAGGPGTELPVVLLMYGDTTIVDMALHQMDMHSTTVDVTMHQERRGSIPGPHAHQQDALPLAQGMLPWVR